MEFKNIQEKVSFLKKQEERVESLKESQSKLNFGDSLIKNLAPSLGFFIITFILFSDIIFSLGFGSSFLIGSIFLEHHGIKKSNLDKIMTEFSIEGVSSIDEYAEKLSIITFNAVADENHQVAQELLAQLEEEKLSRIENEKKPDPFKIIESEE